MPRCTQTRAFFLAFLFSSLLFGSCGESYEIIWEGQSPGECGDTADNDGDGVFDCDDPDCYNAPNCKNNNSSTSATENGSDTELSPDIEKIVAGTYSTCGIKRDGELICWGSLGGDLPPSGLSFKDIALGYEQNCGITSGGTIECWGADPSSPQDAPPGIFEQIEVGQSRFCAIDVNGALHCWGEFEGEPISLPEIQSRTEPPGGRYKAVSVGPYSACAITEGSDLVCWGHGGLSTEKNPPTGKFLSVSVSRNYACAIDTDSVTHCWTGHWEATPHQVVSNLQSVNVFRSGVATEEAFGVPSLSRKACGIRGTGSLTCWGDNVQSEPPVGTFRALAMGLEHGCAISTGGAIQCWGDNSFGQASPP